MPVREHVDVQGTQPLDRFVYLKTANVPTDFPYEHFKDIYSAYEQGLKGGPILPFNPENFRRTGSGQGPRTDDLHSSFEDGTEAPAKGNEEIEYDEVMHTAAVPTTPP